MKPAAKKFKTREAETPPAKRAKSLQGCLLLVLLLLGRLAFAGEPAPLPDFAEIYGRAAVSFSEADFFKPVERDNKALTFKLAPLLLQEVESPAHANSAADRFGTLRFANGTVGLDVSQPAVYVEQGTIAIDGKPHVSFTYLWFYGPGTAVRSNGLPVQGVRLILNSAGEPVVWEILADPSGAELIFVSQSLERAAAAQFGKPLPGRRYAVERGTNEAPATVVARIIEDGPVPMGPIVYLRAGTYAVSTLICRCMPAQAKALRGTTPYQLLPFPNGAPELLELVQKLKARGLATFWSAERTTENRLQTCLRLPNEF